jgi:RHS repeat-associated protein
VPVLFLCFPGQWEDGRWAGAAMGAEVYYNVYRWYQPGIGFYTRPDPAGLVRSNLDLYGYVRRQPLRYLDPYGLLTCVVVSANAMFELGDYAFGFGDHSALLLTGPCRRSSQSCSSPAPMLYDPAGGYVQQFPQAGTAELLTKEIPGWSLGGFFDYHCNSGSDWLEVFCFDTTCCEEKKIDEQIPGSMAPGLCSVGVGGAVRGVGPFASLGGTGTPAILHRAMNRLLKQHTGSGAYAWTHRCPHSASH